MRLTVKDVDKCIGCQSCMFACARRKGEAGLARSSIGIRFAGGDGTRIYRSGLSGLFRPALC
jgi:Fe-S-cluster-containing dehydrogenase component